MTSDPGAAVADYVVPVMLVSLPMFAGLFAKPIGWVRHRRVHRIGSPVREDAFDVLLGWSDSGCDRRLLPCK